MKSSLAIFARRFQLCKGTVASMFKYILSAALFDLCLFLPATTRRSISGMRDVLLSELREDHSISADIHYSSTRCVKGIRFRLPNFGHFQLIDLDRLKNDREWLSDAHVTLSLLYVIIFLVLSLSE